MRILGIDPGFDRIGIAVIEKPEKGKELFIFSECFETNRKVSFADRLCALGERIRTVIQTHTPQILAIEKLYLTQNQKTAMGVAEARGVIVYEARKAGLTLIECTPMEVKVAVTGFGKATKEGVEILVPKLITLPSKKMRDDEVDAIAIALTGSAMLRSRK